MPTLFTVGARGLTPDALEALLSGAGVSTVADVRADPDSGELALCGRRLAERLEGAGMGYVRLEALAGPSQGPEADEAWAVLRGLALDEDVCLLGADVEAAAALAARLAAETGLTCERLGAS